MADNAGNDAITEDIVLQLKTNFEDELLRAANQYSSFQRKAGSVNSSLERSVNSMFRQVSSNLSSMLSGVQQTAGMAINATRGAMRQTLQESIKLSQTYEDHVKRMFDLQRTMRKVANASDISPSTKKLKIDSLQSQMKQDVLETHRSLYQQLGSVSSKASANILDSSKNALMGIRKTITGVRSELADLEIMVGQRKSLGSLFDASASLRDLEQQRKVAEKVIKEQGDRMVEAEKAVQNIRTAMNRQTKLDMKILDDLKDKLTALIKQKDELDKKIATDNNLNSVSRAKAKKREKDGVLNKDEIESRDLGTSIEGQRAAIKAVVTQIETMRKEQEGFYLSAVKNLTAVQNEYSKTEKEAAKLAKTIQETKEYISKNAGGITGDFVSKGILGENKAKEIFGSIEQQHQALINKFKSLSSVKIIDDSVVADFKAQVAGMQSKVKEYETTLKDLRANIQNLEKAKKTGLAPEGIDKSIQERRGALEGLESQLQKAKTLSVDAANQMQRQLGIIAQNTSANILNTTKTSLNSIKQMAFDAKSALVDLEVSVSRRKTGDSVVDAKSGLDQIEKQIKEAQTTVKEQGRNVVAAEKEVQNARLAAMRQTDASLKAEQEAFYAQTVANLNKVKQAHKEAKRELASLTTNVGATKTRITEDAGKIVKDYAAKSNFGEQQARDTFGKIKKEYDSIIGSFKKVPPLAVVDSGAVETFIAKVQQLDSYVQKYENNINELKANIQSLTQLNKTGLAPAGTSQLIESKKAALEGLQQQTRAAVQMSSDAVNQLQVQLGRNAQNTSKAILDSTKGSLNSIKELALKSKEALVDLELEVSQKQNLTSAIGAKEGVAQVEKQLKAAQKLVKEQARNVAAAEKEVQNARIAMSKQTDDKLRAEQEAFLRQAVSNLNKVKQAYRETQKEVDNLAKTLETSKGRIAGEISKVVSFFSTESTNKGDKTSDSFNKIKAEYDAIFEKYKKLSNMRFISREAVDSFTANVNKMKGDIKRYEEDVKALKNTIQQLQQLQSKGLGSPKIGAMIDEYKASLRNLETNIKQITNWSNKAQNEAEQLSKKQSKSMFSTGWEMIRNFRWQVAAFTYLVTRAVQLVRSTFFQVLDDVQKFRTDSMAIAASISYSMLGDVSTNFNKAFQYSTDLMFKLEMAAAKTILTLEDMTMLTKTFTQAGIIPKTDEDIEKIATVGTAIKTLTEGMANAGVQMRQELYAIIQGRQRATDQVAMMFKMIGININDLIKNAKKEGKGMLDVLSEALKPFQEVNKAMANDYSVQLEALDKIWSKIKRLGADNTYKQISRQLSEINNSLVNMKTGELTQSAKEWAFYLGMALETVRLIVVQIGDLFGAIFGVSNATSGWLLVFRGIQGAVWAVSSTLQGVATLIHAVVSSVTGLVAAAVTLATDGPKAAWEVLKITAEDVTSSVLGRLDKIGQRFDDINASAEALQGVLDKGPAKKTELDTFQVTYPQMADTFAKIQSDIDSITLQGLSGAQKVYKEYEQGLLKGAELKEQATKNLQDIKDRIKITKDPKELKTLETMLQAPMDALKKVGAYESALRQRRDKELADLANKETDRIAGITAEYLNLLESLEVAPQTPVEQVMKKYDKLKIHIDKFIEQNKENFAKAGVDVQKLWDAFNGGQKQSTDEALQQMEDAFESFYDSMSSHRVLDPFAQIDNEFEKIKNNIIKATNLNDDQKVSLMETLFIFREERKELVKINLELEKQKAIIEANRSTANVLALSPRTIDKQVAAIMQLEADYADASANIQRSIDAIIDKWKNTPGGVPKDQIEQIEALEKQLENLGIAMEIHKREVQEPFWNDIKEMAQGWADSFADVLNDALHGLTDFSDSFHEFTQQLGRDITKAFIKRNLTDQLMNMVPTIFPQTKTPQASEGMAQEAGIGKSLVDILFTGVKDVSVYLFDTLKTGFDALFGGDGSVFGDIAKGFKSLFESDGIFSGIGDWWQKEFGNVDLFGGITEKISGLFAEDGIFSGIGKMWENVFGGDKEEGGVFSKIGSFFESIFGSEEASPIEKARKQTEIICKCECNKYGGLGGDTFGFGGIEESFVEKFTLLDEELGVVGGDAIKGIGTTFTLLSDEISKTGDSFTSEFGGVLDNLINAFSGALGGGAMNYSFGAGSGPLGGAFNTLLNFGLGMVGSMGNGAGTATPNASGGLTGSSGLSFESLGSNATGTGAGGFKFDYKMAGGGVIAEPVIGRGLRSGSSYAFGEGGIQEAVMPLNKLKGGASKEGLNNLSINIPVSVNGGDVSNKMIAKLKSELQSVVEKTTLRVIKEQI